MFEEALSVDRRHALESFVGDWMASNGVPGAAVAVVDEAGLVYSQEFGARSIDDNAPVTGETLFGFGSCSKPVTATAVVQQAERDELELTDPVNDYLLHL